MLDFVAGLQILLIVLVAMTTGTIIDSLTEMSIVQMHPRYIISANAVKGLKRASGK